MSDFSLDRSRGALLGLAVGDALGTTLEFATRDTRPRVTELVGGGPFRLPPGVWTDDTSMALCLADSLLALGRFEPADVMDRFVRGWRKTNLRLGTLLKLAANEGHEISVALITGEACIETRRGRVEADLSSKAVRNLFENAAVVAMGGESAEALNRAVSKARALSV